MHHVSENFLKSDTEIRAADNVLLYFVVVITGDSGVGKTNFLKRYALGEFHIDSQTTIGVDFNTK